MMRVCKAAIHSGTAPLEWMVVIHCCRMGEEDVFSVPALVQGPSFVSTEMFFYSRKGSLLAGGNQSSYC